MSGPASIHIEHGGVRLHALDHGAPGEKGKPVLLLLHGAAAHAHWWDWIAPALAGGFRPVAVDMRGHGDSAWAESYTYEDFSLDLEAWIEWARAESGVLPAVMGHSMGGVVALRLHEIRPPAIRTLVVVDTPLRITDRILQEVKSFGNRPSRPWASREDFVAKFRLIPSAGKADPARVAHVARHSVRLLEDGTWLLKTDRRFHQGRTPADMRPGWKRVRVPAMYIAGGLSDRHTPEDLQWVREELPHVRIEVIPGAHHHVHIDEPEAFLRTARGFLEQALP